MARQENRRRWVIAGLCAYALGVGLVLLTPVSYAGVVRAIANLLQQSPDSGWFGSGWIEFAANVGLFAPLGFLLTLLLRRHWYGVALGLSVSALAELAQILIPVRQPSLRDVVANVAGAAIGAFLAWLLVLRRDEAPARER